MANFGALDGFRTLGASNILATPIGRTQHAFTSSVENRLQMVGHLDIYNLIIELLIMHYLCKEVALPMIDLGKM